jgi:archaemetzincin
MLELGAAGLAALVVPWGCGESTPMPRPGAVAVQAPTRRAAAVAGPAPPRAARRPCDPADVSLGTEVPFDPNDRAFTPDNEDFEPKRPPRPGDWMARFHERGQSFDEYVASRPTQRQGARDTIVLQPLGAFRRTDRSRLQELAVFTAAFFDTRVRLAPGAPLPKAGRRVRRGTNGPWVQHHTGGILNWLARSKLPPDAVCLLAITMEDLYPEPSWNYVFGEATLDNRVGVYSLARYQAGFWGERETGERRALATLRSYKVLAHETGHMFALHHCRRYECVMNGSNSLEEMDRAPVEPCPVCLEMLQYNLRFDIRARYRRLMTLYERGGLTRERDWIKARLERIGCG